MEIIRHESSPGSLDFMRTRFDRLASRLQGKGARTVLDGNGTPVRLDNALLTRIFDEELARLLVERGQLRDTGDERSFREARTNSEEMILSGVFNPV